MRTFLKSFIDSFKYYPTQPCRAVAMQSGVIPIAEMRRLVADMVD